MGRAVPSIPFTRTEDKDMSAATDAGTSIHEVAPDVFRISTFIPDFGLQFNQFLEIAAHAVDARGGRALGRYTMFHSPWRG